ncbi:MAG: hypothetical protein ABEK50_17730 [bacterium]
MLEKVNRLGQWLSRFPYENLTKRRTMHPRDPDRLLRDKDDLGAGGTCFSLVNLASNQARELGLDPNYYLGDRPDGENRHCVIGFPEIGVFLDPGYLCFSPLPIHPDETVRLRRSHNTLVLDPEPDRRLKVHTERQGQQTWRYTLKGYPIDRDQFEKAWKDSFEWGSVMESEVMTRLTEDGMLLYLNGNLEKITQESRRSLELPQAERIDRLSEAFGVNPELLEDLTITND